jgi:small GTP-binding protein
MSKVRNSTSIQKECYKLKIIIVGDSSVGKTNIINRYVNGEFSRDYMITIGMDFLTCNLELDNKIFKLNLWDTAGSEQFRSVTKGYYSNSCCALIVYDITNEKTFQNVKQWMDDCYAFANKNIHLVLVGNKIDLQQDRKINKETAEEFAGQYGMDFYEVSALSGENIENIFFGICNFISQQIDEGKYDFNEPSVGVSKSNIEEGLKINRNLTQKEKTINKSSKKCCK